jgi:hypothetical protein
LSFVFPDQKSQQALLQKVSAPDEYGADGQLVLPEQRAAHGYVINPPGRRGSATRLCLTAQTLTHFAPRVLVTPKELTCNEGTIARRRCPAIDGTDAVYLAVYEAIENVWKNRR